MAIFVIKLFNNQKIEDIYSFLHNIFAWDAEGKIAKMIWNIPKLFRMQKPISKEGKMLEGCESSCLKGFSMSMT
jgi:hypothetical protein